MERDWWSEAKLFIPSPSYLNLLGRVMEIERTYSDWEARL
jgi:hypothetical protein